MTIREAERRTKQHRKAVPAREPQQVLSFLDWCHLNNISPATGYRLLKAGKGPVITRLSPRRIGVTIGNNAAWQAARADGA